MSDPIQAAGTKLREAGLRRTPACVSVIVLLERSGRPMSVAQILGKLIMGQW